MSKQCRRNHVTQMGWTEVADQIIKGVEGAIGAKTATRDFHRLMDGAALRTRADLEHAVKRLGQEAG